MRQRLMGTCVLSIGMAACQSDGPTAPQGLTEFPPQLNVAAAGSSFDFTLRESIPIPAGIVSLIAVQDMDGDGALDVVLMDHSARVLVILERSGPGFVTRFTEYTGDYYTALRVGDVDADGIPEIGAKSSFGGWFRVYEASGDNAYSRTYHRYVGRYPESVHIGDSDGDGLLEFLVARETFPSRVHRFEGTGNNVYTQIPDLLGHGGDVWLAGVSDLDGDGAPETVFSNNQYYRVPDWRTRADVYVYEGDVRVFYDPAAQLRTTALGDLDGNGLGEILGVDSRTGNMKILESTGVGDGFHVVYDAPRLGYSYWYAFDIDDDGTFELWRALDGGAGKKDVFSLVHRTGSTFIEVYESGVLLQGFPGDIRTIFANGDGNGDGNAELVVVQGSQAHVLELGGTLIVDVDIKPGSDPNSINTRSRGVIPVAILSTASFDAPGEVAWASLTFGATGDEESLARCAGNGEDVNADGLEDLVCHFATQATSFAPGDTEGVLRGETVAGRPLEGRDAVRIVK